LDIYLFVCLIDEKKEKKRKRKKRFIYKDEPTSI